MSYRMTYVCVTWLIHMCDITHPYVWHDSFILWHDPYLWVTWPIHMCDMIHSSAWHDSCICVTWPILMCDMTHSHVWHDPSMCLTWPIHDCDMTHFRLGHDQKKMNKCIGYKISTISRLTNEYKGRVLISENRPQKQKKVRMQGGGSLCMLHALSHRGEWVIWQIVYGSKEWTFNIQFVCRYS